MKTFGSVVLAAAFCVGLGTLVACTETDSTVVNENLDTAAEQFEINRRIVVVNGITDKYELEVQGRCDLSPKTGRLMITCKVSDGKGADAYKRHTVYTSDNVFTVVEQIDAVEASAYHYRVIYKPQTVIADVDFTGSTTDTPKLD